MLAMVLEQARRPLAAQRVPMPSAATHQVLIKVLACGVCRTDLHIVDGELAPHKLPLIPGHEVVGIVVALGSQAQGFRVGDRIGVPWLGHSCGGCSFCRVQRENLCDAALFTGYDQDGGYAEYMVADARYGFHLPDRYDDAHAAPLLCAGLIGYRAYKMAGDANRIGLYGFGAAAHIIAQLARHQGKEIFAFTRPGDVRSQQFARSLGAAWAGAADAAAPAALDAAIIFAPAGALVPQALSATRKGATVVCAGIHMSDIPQFPYSLLWGERSVRSVANLTRADGEEFFRLAQQFDVQTTPVPFAMQDANQALSALRDGSFDGAAVLLNSD
ncbi:zinc-dependent alcohol dehydrogenase family protein [Collimonas sp. OK242]|uniref:zinc-dependent alcohol dehydrogenase family protein n=1 Tax=Collimonas sp. OK242 TaxID=1798195 RepID=UPI000B829A40|nr:zinc-dependent alcohol dehydrogenase family protein [Collimonas sp. OK242]